MRVPVAIGGLLAASSLTWAADIAPGPHPTPPPAPPPPSWAGFYLGIDGGANFLANRTYGFAGLQAGYDLEFDRFVAGVEFSADYRPAKTNNQYYWTGLGFGRFTASLPVFDFFEVCLFFELIGVWDAQPLFRRLSSEEHLEIGGVLA